MKNEEWHEQEAYNWLSANEATYNAANELAREKRFPEFKKRVKELIPNYKLNKQKVDYHELRMRFYPDEMERIELLREAGLEDVDVGIFLSDHWQNMQPVSQNIERAKEYGR